MLQLQSPSRLTVDGDTSILVGGRSVTHFVPEIEIRRWRSHSVRLRLLYDEEGIVTQDQRALVWTALSIEARWYRLPDSRFEFATVFYGALPQVVRFQLTTDGEVATYAQPAFANRAADGSTWERAQHGGIRRRPIDVEDSFAFYVPWSGNYEGCGGPNYGSGKVAHLYRPWIVDAIGRRAWCGVSLERGILTLRIPQAFRDVALGPCLLDPTFGYTTVGGSDDNPGPNWLWMKATTNPSAGTLTSVTIWGRRKTGTAANHWPAIYLDNAGAVGAKVASNNSVDASTNYGVSDAAVDTAISASLTAQQYWLGSVNYNSGSSDAWFKFDTNGSLTENYFKTETGNWPADGTGATANANSRPTIFGNYTASGGGGARFLLVR